MGDQGNLRPVSIQERILFEEPTFEDYVVARRVVLYEYEQIRNELYAGNLSVASDELLARIVHKSCFRFRHFTMDIKDMVRKAKEQNERES